MAQAQDSLAESYFLNNIYIEKIKNRFSWIGSRQWWIFVDKNWWKGNYFIWRYDEGKDVDVLFIEENWGQFRRLNFLTPSTYASHIKNISILEPSHEWTKIAIGFDPRRSLPPQFLFMIFKQKKMLKDQITQY